MRSCKRPRPPAAISRANCSTTRAEKGGAVSRTSAATSASSRRVFADHARRPSLTPAVGHSFPVSLMITYSTPVASSNAYVSYCARRSKARKHWSITSGAPRSAHARASRSRAGPFHTVPVGLFGLATRTASISGCAANGSPACSSAPTVGPAGVRGRAAAQGCSRSRGGPTPPCAAAGRVLPPQRRSRPWRSRTYYAPAADGCRGLPERVQERGCARTSRTGYGVRRASSISSVSRPRMAAWPGVGSNRG